MNVNVNTLAKSDALARRLGLTRSLLIAEAIADFLDLHGDGT